MPLEKIEKLIGDTLPFQFKEDEKLNFSLSFVELFTKIDSSEGKGTLYVTSKRIIWFPDTYNSKEGFTVDFHHILAHAIARTGSFEFEIM